MCASLNLSINNNNNFDLLSGKIVYYTIHTSKNKIGSKIIFFLSLSLLNLNFLKGNEKQEPAQTHTHTNQIESTRPKINPYVAYMQEQLIHLFLGRLRYSFLFLFFASRSI